MIVDILKQNGYRKINSIHYKKRNLIIEICGYIRIFYKKDLFLIIHGYQNYTLEDINEMLLTITRYEKIKKLNETKY